MRPLEEGKESKREEREVSSRIVGFIRRASMLLFIPCFLASGGQEWRVDSRTNVCSLEVDLYSSLIDVGRAGGGGAKLSDQAVLDLYCPFPEEKSTRLRIYDLAVSKKGRRWSWEDPGFGGEFGETGEEEKVRKR